MTNLKPAQVSHHQTLVVRHYAGLQPYIPCWQAMQRFTRARLPETPDEIWLLEHESVYTQGQNGKPEHLLNPQDTPVVHTDRGGQVTWHGPGQLVVYLLLDLRRRRLNIRELVSYCENSVISLLKTLGVDAYAKREAPGVYVRHPGLAGKEAKICSIGLRVHKGCTYHGFALNISSSPEPFTCINPCGFPDMPVTRMLDLTSHPLSTESIALQLIHFLLADSGYNAVIHTAENNGYKETQDVAEPSHTGHTPTG